MGRAYATVNAMYNRGISNVPANNAKNGKAPKPVKEKKWMAKFTREQILDMRTKHELEGWSRAKVQAHFGMTYNETKRYLEYATAKDVFPKRP